MRLIQSYREKYDLPFIDVVSHHFTIAFGLPEIDSGDYINHIRRIAENTKRICFNCRYAMPCSNDFNDNYHVFLVPVDIPYIPHITVATIPDSRKVKMLCDELNATDLEITGSLDSVTIGHYDGSVVHNLETFKLAD